MEPKFQVDRTFELLSRGEVTLFMAVPTIYSKLIHAWERSGVEARQRFSKGCSQIRLMVSGSAALPVQIGEMWKAITGHTLLERYGMTEIGMALSNPLHGPRKLGFVGTPLPGVEVKLADDSGEEVCRDNVSGEVYVRGDTVFREYWGQEQTTREAFDQGWFKTGDIALRRKGYYRIEGRRSVDIIKSGGYKVSALEIEEVLRTHPRIRDCSVVGIPDEKWGERVAAAVLTPAQSIDLAELRAWASARLARQKVPSRLLVLEDFPRNALGKVVKPELKELFLQRLEKGSPVE
jgi:malonyl-CoA/methylmalonyl-CoA synthetase